MTRKFVFALYQQKYNFIDTVNIKLYKENAMEMRQNSFHRVFYLFIIETKSIKNDTRNARNVFWNDARPALGKRVFEQYNQP